MKKKKKKNPRFVFLADVALSTLFLKKKTRPSFSHQKNKNRLPGDDDENGDDGAGTSGGGLSALFARARRRRRNGEGGGDESTTTTPLLSPPSPSPSPPSPQQQPLQPQRTLFSAKNVDASLSRLYRYHEEGGFTAVALSRALNLLAILFTAAFATTLLLVVKWGELAESQCLKEDSCDIADVALDFSPLRHYWAGKRPDLGFGRVVGALMLLAALGCFFVASAVAAVADVRAALESRAVCEGVLGLSERSLRRVSWAEVARRLVEAQREERRSGGGRDDGGNGNGNGRGGGRSFPHDDDDDGEEDFDDIDPDDLCRTSSSNRPLLGPLASDPATVLDEPLLAARIMRRDNYLIALLTEGLVPLAPRAWQLTPEEENDENDGNDGNSSKLRRAWRRVASSSRKLLRKVPLKFLPSLPPSLAAAYEWNLRAVLLEPMFVLSSSSSSDGGEGEGSESENDDENDDGGEGGRRRRRREGQNKPFPPPPPLVVLSREATDPLALAARSRRFALLNALAAPFALALLFVLLFMRHAERLYHHPSTAAARGWSRLARWRVREFNELPGTLERRLERSRPAAERYVAGFPSPASAAAAKFVAFVAGSGAALLLLVAVLQDRLLERSLWGRHLVWWIALLGIVLAGSRSWAEGGGSGSGSGSGGTSSHVAHAVRRRNRLPAPPSSRSSASASAAAALASSPSFRSSRSRSGFSWDEQDAALLDVASFTHFYPRRWRGRGGSRATQQEFEEMFPPALASLLLSEVAALVAVPLILWRDLPRAASEICEFVGRNTVRIDGVGDVCSLSAFRGGSGKEGTGDGNGNENGDVDGKTKTKPDLSASALALLSQSREGKLEKSLLSFAGEYPEWEPDRESRALLEAVARKCKEKSSGGGGSGGGGGSKGSGGGGGDGAFPAALAASSSSLLGSILLRGGEQETEKPKPKRRPAMAARRRDTAFGSSSELQQAEEEEEDDDDDEKPPPPAAFAAASRSAFLPPGDGGEGDLAVAHLALLASLDLGEERDGGRRREEGGGGGAGAARARRQQQPPPSPPQPPPPPPPPQQQQRPPPSAPPPPPIRFFPSAAAAPPIAFASPQALRGFGAFGEEHELASLSPSPSPAASFPRPSSISAPRPSPAPAFPLPPLPPASGALARQLRAVGAAAVPPPAAFDAPSAADAAPSSSPSSSSLSSSRQQQQQQPHPPPHVSSSSPAAAAAAAAAVCTWPPAPLYGENDDDSDDEGARGSGGGGFGFGALGGGGGGGSSNANTASAAASTLMMPWAAMPPDLDEPALDAAADPWGVAARGGGGQ